MLTIAKGDVCQNGNCAHVATNIWIGSGGTLAMVRSGMQQKWCNCCVWKAQLAYAEEAVPRIVALRAKLAKLPKGCRDAPLR